MKMALTLPPPSPNSFAGLPTEIVIEILLYLEVDSLLATSRVGASDIALRDDEQH